MPSVLIFFNLSPFFVFVLIFYKGFCKLVGAGRVVSALYAGQKFDNFVYGAVVYKFCYPL